MPLAVLAAVFGLLGGCAGTSARPPTPAPTSPIAESHLSFDRTFDLARAALSDQKLAIEKQDRRTGVIVGTDGAVAVTATLEPIREGPIRVTFRQQPEGADPALLQRVIAAYHARMAQFGVFRGFDSPGGSGSGGPVPCPSGPAFCN
ncbi:MAG: hypothetical protein J0L57_13160 [Burkholderiales bacterium]|nr:hypothetical protein [Burkholderiales bacterium]